MGAHFRPVKWDRVLIDICTQRDYLDAGGILQVANRDKLLPVLKETFRWARSEQLPIVSCVESHRPSEPLGGFPLHCIDGTPGQEKVTFSVLQPSIVVETDNYLSLPPDLTTKYRQIIFRKRTRDLLSNPKADRFLTQSTSELFILFGVGLEHAIKSLALGLLARHKSVAVISDACGYWSSADADLSLRQLSAKGVRLLTLEQFKAERPAPRPRVRPAALVDRHNPAERPAARTGTGARTARR